MILAGADERRRDDSAHKGQDRDSFGIAPDRDHRRQSCHGDHHRECSGLREHAVVMPAGPQREVQHSGPEPGDSF